MERIRQLNTSGSAPSSSSSEPLNKNSNDGELPTSESLVPGNLVEWPPSVKNNYNKPMIREGKDIRSLFGEELLALSQSFNERTQKQAWLEMLQDGSVPAEGPWVFFTGFGPEEAFIFREIFAPDLGYKPEDLKVMSDFYRRQKPAILIPWTEEDDGMFEGMYWSVNSKAFGQLAQGDIYLLLPKGAPVNNAYKNSEGRPSFFWTFEVGDLTRNPKVRQIYRVQVSEDESSPLRSYEFDRVWKQGDEPRGYPVSPYNFMVTPEEDFFPIGETIDLDIDKIP
jgi:hypothetical protein